MILSVQFFGLILLILVGIIGYAEEHRLKRGSIFNILLVFAADGCWCSLFACFALMLFSYFFYLFETMLLALLFLFMSIGLLVLAVVHILRAVGLIYLYLFVGLGGFWLYMIVMEMY